MRVLAYCKMGISIYFLTVTYLLTTAFVITCCKKTPNNQNHKKNHHHRRYCKINCFLTGSIIFNAKATLLFTLLTIPDCCVLHVITCLYSAALSPLCCEDCVILSCYACTTSHVVM